MTMNVLIAPDFAPEHFAGWHMLNTHLQKKTGLKLHLMTPGSPKEQNELIAAGKVDLIYANPFDSAAMVRDGVAWHAGTSVDKLIRVTDAEGNPAPPPTSWSSA